MATFVQRWQAHCDALLNRTATAAELGRIGKAIATQTLIPNYDSMTNAQKAEVCLIYARKHYLGLVKAAEGMAAEAAARDVAATTVEADFTPTP